MLAPELDVSTLMPPQLKPWLADRSSLTLRLKALCRRFEVELLREWQQPAEQSGNGWHNGDPLWLREVLLRLDGEPWVYALTEIPVATMERCEVDFQQLGTRPLGEVLFGHQQMRAGQLVISHFDDQSRPAQIARQHGQQLYGGLWGRSREFHLDGQPLRVNEVFLPIAEQRLR